MADTQKRDSSTRFAHSSVLADAACAAQLRQEFSVWLKRHFAVDATKASDVVLAVNEALANAAGTMGAGRSGGTVDARDSKSRGREAVWVRLPPSARPRRRQPTSTPHGYAFHA